MIYLIDDDRRGQQDEYRCDFLKTTEFKDILTVIKTIDQDKDLSFLSNADSILIHSSFPDTAKNHEIVEGKNTVYDKIIEIVEYNSIPTMIFTNSVLDIDHRVKINGTAYRMNKRVFYLNLKSFLDYFNCCRIIEFKNLYYGKDFLAHDLALLSADISVIIQTKGITSNKDQLTSLVTEFGEKSNDLKHMMSMWNELLNGSASTSAFIKLTEKIIQSFAQYGRNIYSQ